MAMTILNIAILAIVAAFNSGTFAIKRASRISTASALADAQMELYRALTYTSISLDTAATAAADSVYKGDSAWNASQVTATCPGLPNACNPSRAATGADGGSYRIDTYIVLQTPTNGRPLKLLTVVVRNASALSARPYVRIASTFDQSTG